MKSTVKVFRTLESICLDSPGGVTELSQRLDINKSTMHRFLSVLAQLGYVYRDEKSGKYVPTLKVYQLGVTIKNRLGFTNIVKPYMERLCDVIRETVNLGVFAHNWVVVVERVESRDSAHAHLVIRDPMPAYCSALGKVFLAHASDEEFDRYCKDNELKPLTGRTINTVTKLKNALEKVRRAGYAIDDRELHDGIRCIAAPIFDEAGKVTAGISASGSSSVLTVDRLQEFSPTLVSTCQEISKNLGHLIE